MLTLFLTFLLLAVASSHFDDVDLLIPGCRPPTTPAIPVSERLQVDCGRQFPQNDFNKALRADDKMKSILDTYENPPTADSSHSRCTSDEDVDEQDDAPSRFESAPGRTKRHLPFGWHSLCPSRTSYMWHGRINLGKTHGWCFILTPIRREICRTRFCMWTGWWPFYRCKQNYPWTYFWAFCPDSSIGPFQFVRRRIPQGCCCERYWCPGW